MLSEIVVSRNGYRRLEKLLYFEKVSVLSKFESNYTVRVCLLESVHFHKSQLQLTIFLSWLVSKRDDDEAEGLWRIRDTLYDFTNFIDKHPGGSFWLKETKGTDITELFEAHHLSSLPASLIDSYKVRDAMNERIYTLTMHENGFYQTLKRRVRDKLPTIDVKRRSNSDVSSIDI